MSYETDLAAPANPFPTDGLAALTDCDTVPVERVSDSDRALVARLTTRLAELQAEAQGIQTLVSGHLATLYGLQTGDRVEDDGRITRASQTVPS